MVAYEPIIDLATEDHRRKGYTPDAATTFRKVKEQFGKNSTTVAAEALRLRFGPGELTLAGYILYRLYDERYTWEDKTCFLSDSLHWQIVGCCCPRHWRAATEDKWLAYSVLERHGFRVPRTLAVVHAGRRLFGR